MFKHITTGLMIAIGMILMPVINIALDPNKEIKAFEETQNLTLADTVLWPELNNHTLREVFESTIPALENLVTNGNGITLTGWSVGGSVTIENNTFKIDSSSAISLTQNVSILQTQIIHYRILYKGDGLSPESNLAFQLRNASNVTSSNVVLLSNANTSWTLSKGAFALTDTITNMIISRSGVGSVTFLDNIQLFNLTTSYGVTSTSGTAYDNAVAQIEWLLSKNDGYIQSVGNPFEIVDLTVSQMDYYYEKYLDYKEIEAIITPPLDVDGCYPAAGCYTYFELGRVMFNDGLLSMIPRQVNGHISFPIFSNLFQLAENGATYLFVPMLNFLSDFVPFIKYDNSDVVYLEEYHSLLDWVYVKKPIVGTDLTSDFYYYDTSLSDRKVWYWWNGTEYKYIGFDMNEQIYRYYYKRVNFLGGVVWSQSDEAISPEEMKQYNYTYNWKE